MLVKNSISSFFTRYSTLRIALGILLLASLAQIQIPIKPVPITFHTVGAILIGLLYSPKEALYTWASYLFLGGIINFPVFTNFAFGIEKLIGPSCGYYYGMMASSWVLAVIIAKFRPSLKSTINFVALTLLAQIITYFFGVFVLAIFIGLENAFYSGFVVFIPSGVIKTGALTVLFKLVYENIN